MYFLVLIAISYVYGEFIAEILFLMIFCELHLIILGRVKILLVFLVGPAISI